MAASKEPSEDAIRDFMGVTGLQAGEAIRWLKVKCVNVLQRARLTHVFLDIQQ